MARTASPFGALSYASCTVAAAPLRAEPSHRAEQTSQILFGERVEVLRNNLDTEWVQVRCSWDQYEGWCKAGQITTISSKSFHKEARRLSMNHKGQLIGASGVLQLPLGAELTGIKRGKLPMGYETGSFKGRKEDLRNLMPSSEIMLAIARSFLNSPYQWGGRCLAGIDCSGLVQVAYKMIGVALPRDAADQALAGAEVHFLAEALPGDLVFFDNAEGRIVHVGIYCGGHKILHATDTSGRVVEDKIDNAGIISVFLKKRTHNLRTIRRVL
jgi:cell wall-associated NlpC family hydrolase